MSYQLSYQLNPQETREIRQQLACAWIAGDHRLETTCLKALEGRDRDALRDAKALCRIIREAA